MRLAGSLRLVAVAFALGFGIAQSASAALIGVAGQLGGPLVNYDVTGDVNYDATTDTFTITNSFTFGSTAPVADFETFALSISVDEFGVLGGGTVEVGAGGSILSASVDEFGFLDAGGGTGLYDFVLTAQSGSLLPGTYAAGQTLLMTLDSSASTFTGSFGSDFSGNAKGSVGAVVPEPSSALMTGVALLFVHLRARRRH